MPEFGRSSIPSVAVNGWVLSHAIANRIIKGEDVMFVSNLPAPIGSMLYMVCDGHLGVDAASFVEETFVQFLTPLIPPMLPDFSDRRAVEQFAEKLRMALCQVFVMIENEWSTFGHLAGTTVTAVIITGSLLTCANLGDSSAVLDTGCSMVELISSHRIQDSTYEQERLKLAGRQLAQLGFHLQGPAKPGQPGVGPVRIWPGGLCVGRSIGDADAGPEVVPLPHIKQMMIPELGCRVIIASDGLWDVITLTKAVKLARSKPTSAAATALCDCVLRDLRFMDDTSIIVLDALPAGSSPFPTVALQAALHPDVVQRNKASGGGLCGCFGAEAQETDASTVGGGPGKISLLADVDTLTAFPSLVDQLVHKPLGSGSSTSNIGPSNPRSDYTMHAGQNFFAGGLPLSPTTSGGTPLTPRTSNVDISAHSALATMHEGHDGEEEEDGGSEKLQKGNPLYAMASSAPAGGSLSMT